MKDQLHEVATATLAFAAGLVPAALGAAVTLAYETGLSWGRRFVQLSVGIVVSYFATGVVAAFWSLNPFLVQAISFVIGMIAFKATPRVNGVLTERAADAVGALLDRLLPRKDEK